MRPLFCCGGATGRMNGLPVGSSRSTTMVLRSLRTWCATGCDRVILTRAVGAPSDSSGSTVTPAIGLRPLAEKAFATPSPLTFRKSTVMVSGSGRAATYPTGSVASITSDAPLLWTREVIAVSRALAVIAVAAGPDARSSVPAVTTVRNRARPLFTATPCRFRVNAAICESRAASRVKADR